MKKIKTFLFIVFIFNFIYPQQIEQNNDLNVEFERAVKLFEEQHYIEALNIFNWIVEKNSYNNKTTPSFLFIVKIYLKQNSYDMAESVVRKFINDYPKTKYLDEAKILLSEILIQKGDPKKAVTVLFSILEESTSGEYKSTAKEVAENLIYKNFFLSDVIDLIHKTPQKELQSYLYLVLGKYQLIENRTEEAKLSFRYILDNFYDSEEYLEALKFYGRSFLTNSSEKNIKNAIAILLPLSEDSTNNLSSTASEVLEGIKFAVDEFNNLNSVKVGLIINDTKRNKLEIEKIYNELSQLKVIDAIIGPLFSDETKEVCNSFANDGLPIITPTATDDELSKSFPNLYQANPSFEMRGRAMAQYIFFVENKKNIALLYSLVGYSKNIAEAFIAEYEKLGGKIVIRNTFFNNDLSVVQQLTEFKSKINEIEGIYIPLSESKTASIILSSLIQTGINLPIYGNQDWFKAKGLESATSITNNLTFTSDYFIDYKDKEYVEFNKKFFLLTNMEANRNVLYGYDVATFLLGIISKAFEDNSNISSLLSKEISSFGFHNNISFYNSQINRFINFVRFKDGKFELIDRFKVEN
jgi:branched-chain amino acid transport system substrate-binding protein